MIAQGLGVAVTGWVDRVDRRHGFALSHPEEWQASDGISGLLLSLAAPVGETSNFRPNMNVVRRVRDTTRDLDGLADSALTALGRLLTEPVVVDLDTAVVGGRPARRLLVAYRQGIHALTSEQWLFMDDDHVWTISAGAAAEDWGRVADVFAEVVRTFRLDTA